MEWKGETVMKLADISNGPEWLVWVVIIILAVLSIVLISGRGSWFISGYNTATKEEKAKYNEKKLCRTTGVGMAVATAVILVTELFEDMLPAESVYVIAAVILADCLVMIIVGNTACRK